MGRSHRRSRWLNRIFFALVIAAGLYGWYYGDRNWRPDASAIEIASLAGGPDWTDLVAGVLEDAIQIFQEITSQPQR